MASCSTDAGSSQHPVSSSLSRPLNVPAIFLSHSGKQKPFVEHLYNALQKVNHNAFFDKHCLPKGDPFPDHIKIAASECTLGVVVLTNDFLTSKWPLIELEILVKQRGLNPKVLPLFYKLEPKDLKSPKKLIEWRKKWEELARNPAEVVQWEEAVKGLPKFNGEIFREGDSETQYIKSVVDSICKQVPCPLPYDMTEIRGQGRLVEEVAKQFDHVRQKRQNGGACIVGLHGIGGLGKSTMCKGMVNFYWSKYPGKSHHLELPTNGSDMEIMQECKHALEVLVDLDKKLLEKAVDIDQVIKLMKEHLAQHDMFLTIDNVWESSREVAQRILKVGFSSESKILVTSRSEEILKDLLWEQKNLYVGSLPAPNCEEARQIFQDALRLDAPNSLVRETHLVDGALARCNFGDAYHALALKALGLLVKNVCVVGDSGDLSQILREIESIDLPKRVEDVIRRSYDSLEDRKKHMFLDIVVLPGMRGHLDRITVEKVYQWLSFLYEDQSTGKANINLKSTIRELCLDGLLQLETVGFTGVKMIKVHDLLYELAQREAARSSRFFIAGRSSCALEEIRWPELERVTLDGCCDVQFIEKLQRQECRRLQVLDARGVEFRQGFDMRCMPALRVLMFCDVSLRSILIWPASALAVIDLEKVRFQQPFGRMPRIKYRGVMSLKDVAALRMPDIEGIKGLSTLKTLQDLRLESCESLKGILDVSGSSSSLRDVEISGCGALERLAEMRGFTRLERLEIYECASLKGIPDLSGLAGLDRLVLGWNRSMEEVGGLSSNLRVVSILRCPALERVPDMRGLTRLESLEISCCESLKGIPDLSGLARLDRLELVENTSMEEVGGLSSSLRIVIITWSALKKVPDISGLTRLQKLRLIENDALEEVEGQSVSSTLTELCLMGSPRLRRCPESLLAASALLNDATYLKEQLVPSHISPCSLPPRTPPRVPDISAVVHIPAILKM